MVAAALEDMRPAIDENPEGVLSGEWTENFSLVSYDDLRQYLESQIIDTDKVVPLQIRPHPTIQSPLQFP